MFRFIKSTCTRALFYFYSSASITKMGGKTENTLGLMAVLMNVRGFDLMNALVFALKNACLDRYIYIFCYLCFVN